MQIYKQQAKEEYSKQHIHIYNFIERMMDHILSYKFATLILRLNLLFMSKHL
jgi:hypothetical protein